MGEESDGVILGLPEENQCLGLRFSRIFQLRDKGYENWDKM